MNLTPKDIDWIKQIMQPVASLNSPVRVGEYGEEVEEMGSFIEDPGPGPEELFLEQEKSERLDKYMREFLSPREYKILRMRYGLDTGQFRTLESVADELNITRERVRQIEKTALRRLRGRFMARGITEDDL